MYALIHRSLAAPVSLHASRSRQPDTPSDAELVARARDGDRRAFRTLIETYEADVTATIVALLGPSGEVDDVAQEVFIGFYDALDKYRGEASVKTYLKRIATYRSLDVLRKRKRTQARFRRLDQDETTHALPADDETEAADRREREALVHRALQALPPKHRAVVVLRMIEGYSTEETAQLLNLNYGTVLSRLSRAQKKMKTFLAPYLEEASSDPDEPPAGDA